MLTVLNNSWALLFGMFLLMLGNGMQGTVLGVRGSLEGFDPTVMGVVMAGYFLGFLGGAQATPWLVRRVGHVRVFAALASLVSAACIIYAAAVDPIAWTIMRILVGFCFSGVYVVAESWLNDQTDNETRGQTLSAYVMVQMMGIVLAQALLNVADPGGYDLFVIMSVAVSISFAPILLSVSPAPVYGATRRMPLTQLVRVSPLGCFGLFMLGGIFACLFGMSSVYATEIGLTNIEISIFIGAIYLGGMVLQYPIGWLSDRMDRRRLIVFVTAAGVAGCALAYFVEANFGAALGAAVLIGGSANPLYALLVAHTNDFLDPEDMASAAGSLTTLTGLGAVGTPVLVGYLMASFGPSVYLAFLAVLLGSITLYALYRTTVRPAKSVEETLPYSPISQASSAVVVGWAQDIAIEGAQTEEETSVAPGPA